MQHNGRDHALKVTAEGTGLVGHAGAVLLRKAADQAGLTRLLSPALRKAGTSPALDRGIVLVSMAAAIALGATSMSGIAVLAHLAPVLGDAPSGPAVRRALDLAGTPAVPDRIARARARARAHVWDLIRQAPAGFPWLAVAGKTLTGWLVGGTGSEATGVTGLAGHLPRQTESAGRHRVCGNQRDAWVADNYNQSTTVLALHWNGKRWHSRGAGCMPEIDTTSPHDVWMTICGEKARSQGCCCTRTGATSGRCGGHR
jgi:hypothetical protein